MTPSATLVDPGHPVDKNFVIEVRTALGSNDRFAESPE